MEATNNEAGRIDKKELYGSYAKEAHKHHRLQREGVAKALDIPWDEDNVNINSGVSGKHLVVLGALALAGLLGWHGIDRLSTPMAEPPAAVSPAVPQTPLAEPQKFRVRFHAEDGTEIDVEPEQ